MKAQVGTFNKEKASNIVNISYFVWLWNTLQLWNLFYHIVTFYVWHFLARLVRNLPGDQPWNLLARLGGNAPAAGIL